MKNQTLSDAFYLFTTAGSFRNRIKCYHTYYAYKANGKLYATDGAIVISCDDTYDDGSVITRINENRPFPVDLIESARPEPNTHQVLKINPKAFDKYRLKKPIKNDDGYKPRLFELSSVMLNGLGFDMEYFYKIIQTQSIIGGDVVLLHQPKTPSWALFKVGYCEVMLGHLENPSAFKKSLIIKNQ